MAARFWVGGAGTWDATDTTHWASVTNGAGGQTVPTSADTVTFDASSGTGTITINGNHSISSFTCTAGSGMTWDWSVNNNNLTIAGVFNLNNAAANTIKLGNGTFYAGGGWFVQGASLTYISGNSIVALTDPTTTADKSFGTGAGITQTNVQFGPCNGWGGVSLSSSTAVVNLTVVAPCKIKMASAVILTVTTLAQTATKGKAVEWRGTGTVIAGLSIASGTVVLNWSTCRHTAFQGGATFKANNSFDLGLTTGIAISPPRAGMIIGG